MVAEALTGTRSVRTDPGRVHAFGERLLDLVREFGESSSPAHADQGHWLPITLCPWALDYEDPDPRAESSAR